MAIPAKQAIQEITDLINEELSKMPDDATKIAALNALSGYMFNKAFNGDDNGGVDLLKKASEK